MRDIYTRKLKHLVKDWIHRLFPANEEYPVILHMKCYSHQSISQKKLKTNTEDLNYPRCALLTRYFLVPYRRNNPQIS